MIVESCAFGLNHVDWGTVPEWIGGIGTAGALFFAFAGWRIAVQERHDAALAAREQADRDRRAHAQQFTCWPGGSSSTSANDGRMRFGLNVYVLNNSQHTFLNVEVHATATGSGGWQEKAIARWPQLTPNPNAVAESREAAVLHEDTGERPLVMPRWTVEAWLTDVNGVRWHYRDGMLETLRESAGMPSTVLESTP